MRAHKNSGIQPANHWQQEALFYTAIAMVLSIVISRAALSATTILFVLLATVHKNFFPQLKRFFATPYLLLFSLLFFIPLVSGLWSENMKQWADVVRIKLPLLFLPIAAAGTWVFSDKKWKALALVFLALIFGCCIWSLAYYLKDTTAMHEAYLKAKTIPTPLENDHVRFSWLVSIAVALCLLLLHLWQQRRLQYVLAFLSIFFAIYLHILSARTGIISLYLILLVYAGWLVKRVASKRFVIVAALFILLMPLAAYLLLPTFKARIHYNIYDLSFVKKTEYLPGSSDGARVMSLKAGWQVLKENPFGVGAGDIRTEANKWYQANVPQVLPSDQFYPSSEWLMYGGFAGWLGVFLFTIVMAAAFIYRPKAHGTFWMMLQTTAAFSFAFDMGLEVQYGVFLYAFLTVWWWKWFTASNDLKHLSGEA